jgi:hypothetical protein
VDWLHPSRTRIEPESAKGEKTLFNLDGRSYLRDLTATYFGRRVLERGDAPAVAVSLGMEWKNVFWSALGW